MRRRHFHHLACWISVALFFLAASPGLAAMLDRCHLHTASPRACATLSSSYCSSASEEAVSGCAEKKFCRFVETAQFSPNQQRSLPCPFCPDCPGDCCFCIVAKAPCVLVVAFPIPSASSWNQEWVEASVDYAPPFCGILTPPPKG